MLQEHIEKNPPKLTSAKENLKRWLLIDFVFCHLKRTSFKASWLIMRKLTGVLYNLYTLTNKWVIFQTCFFNSIDVIFFLPKISLMCVIFPNSIISVLHTCTTIHPYFTWYESKFSSFDQLKLYEDNPFDCDGFPPFQTKA